MGPDLKNQGLKFTKIISDTLVKYTLKIWGILLPMVFRCSYMPLYIDNQTILSRKKKTANPSYLITTNCEL
jgi:hypothetical protein